MKLINLKVTILLFIMLSSFQLFSITRDNVVINAEAYKNHQWTVRVNNILDMWTYKKTDNKIIIDTTTGNNIDDRREEDMYINYPDEPRKWWPYTVDLTTRGVAYAWKRWDSTTVFKDRLDKGKIAGARKKDVDEYGVNRFTGTDCSGFVGRMINATKKLTTETIPKYCVKLTDVKELKPGDILNKSNEHTILFHSWISKPRLAKIIHATSYQWYKRQYMWRVVDDSATVSGSRIPMTLGATSTYGYYPYSPFPIFTDLSPLDGTTLTVSTDTIKVVIKSGDKTAGLNKVKRDSIILKLFKSKMEKK